MTARLVGWCALLVLTAAVAACRDSATSPRAGSVGRGPAFATATDTTGGGGGGVSQAHFIASGDFGSANWSGGDSASGGGFTFGSLSVNRGGQLDSNQTFLTYFVDQCNAFFTCTVSAGAGVIPNSDLTGGGKTLHLSTNTTGNPNFTTFAGPTGLVSVAWTSNGLFQQRSSGTSEFVFPSFREHLNGVSSSAAANVTGTVVGNAISGNGSGNLGTNLNVTIDIFH
jgi:hypothetical protein